MAKITFGDDSSSQSESSDFDSGDSDMQQLGNTFARNIVHPEMNQKGITLDSLSYQYAEPISTPISAQIPTKLKKKIWKKRYIDIGLLLPKVNLQPDFQKFSLEVSPNADISLVPKSKTKKIFSIELWTTAFLRYIAVYTEKFPGENQQLLKYCEIIRDLAQRKHGLAWSHYDQNFRLLRENFPVPWDRIHTEYGAFVRPDLSNECAIPNILKALRFRLHFHCIFLFPCISKQAFNKCPFSTHEMCSSCHLTNHFFPQPFFGSSFK